MTYKKKDFFSTKIGFIYQSDCINLMKNIKGGEVDLFFADPPFNLDKEYDSKMIDKISPMRYLEWCRSWIDEGVRILKPGGSFFIWNLPKWNVILCQHLNKNLNFKNWISVDFKCSMPINKRLYPAHYSLLYYTKGDKANVFIPDRLPVEICRNCSGDIKDYGGKKSKLNPKGISLTDIWTDISPVRHSKYKHRKANQLPLKLMDRIIEMSTNEGDIVFDPFAGSGTTFIVSELKKRRWAGCELGSIDVIRERFKDIKKEQEHLDKIQNNKNILYP